MLINEKFKTLLSDKKFVFPMSIFIIFIISYVFFYSLIFKTFDIDLISNMNCKNDCKINDNIVVIEIDDKTVNNLGFPIERKDYLPFLDNLNKTDSKPRVLGFDILFLDKSKNELADKALAKKIKEIGNIVLPIDININGGHSIEPIFAKEAKNLGFVLPQINPLTSKVYSIYPALNLKLDGQKKSYESFGFSMVREYFDKGNIPINTNLKNSNYDFLDGQYNIPLSTNYGKKGTLIDGDYFFNYSNKIKDFHIKFIRPGNFQRVSFVDIYNGNYDKKLLKDKIVLVGFTAEGIDNDNFILPGIGITKGVYIHANVISTLLNNSGYIYHFNPLLEILLGLFIIFIIIVSFYFTRKLKISLAVLWVTGTIGFISIIWQLLFNTIFKSNNYYVFNFFYELITLSFLSIMFGIYFRYTLEDKNKLLLSRALGEYVSKEISDEILSGKGNVNLSGENKKITIFFSDIAGFTTISEKLTPEKLVEFLRVYLGRMSDIIVERRGFINKYEGDAIMALWGVFGEEDRYGVIDACNSCLEQQVRIKQLNEIWREEGRDEISARMGLHCGNAIVGNIGSMGKKMEFTALGDSVNLGSRLEGVNKFYGTLICTSEVIYDEAKNDFIFRYLDIIRVKGKNLGVKIYELVGRIGEVKDEKLAQIKNFEIGVKHYSNQEFDKAIEIFKELGNLGDKTSEIYLKRCENFLKNPPPNNWDGIYTMEEK